MAESPEKKENRINIDISLPRAAELVSVHRDKDIDPQDMRSCQRRHDLTQIVRGALKIYATAASAVKDGGDLYEERPISSGGASKIIFGFDEERGKTIKVSLFDKERSSKLKSARGEKLAKSATVKEYMRILIPISTVKALLEIHSGPEIDFMLSQKGAGSTAGRLFNVAQRIYFTRRRKEAEAKIHRIVDVALQIWGDATRARKAARPVYLLTPKGRIPLFK